MSLRILEKEYSFILTSIVNLALTYRNQEQLKKTEELEVQVIKMKKRVLEKKYLDTLASIANLILIYKN